MDNFSIGLITYGIMQSNTYILAKDCKAVIIDAGAPPAKIAKEAKSKGRKICAVLLTHGHFDHADYAAEFSALGYPIYMAESDVGITAAGIKTKPFNIDYPPSDGETLDIAGFKIKVISVPGHTAGSLCYYFEAEKVIFTGDTLFCGSVGRTDFSGGNHNMLIANIKSKLLLLPDDTAVCPGHGEPTTIWAEKKYNPFIK